MEAVGQQATHLKEESLDDLNEPSELLSRALKRKFTELDEITQRLRLRLSKVTEEDSDGSSDGVADQFEKDINTLSIEEDFDLINFEENVNKLQKPQITENDKHDIDLNILMTKNQKMNDENDDSKESSKTSNLQSRSESSLSSEAFNNGES